MTTKKKAGRSKRGRQVPRTEEDFKILDEVSLSPKQLVFIEHYLATGNKKTAAEKAGVSRTTPYDWFRADFEFQAEVNRRQREQREEFRARLSTMRPLMAEGIQTSIKDGNMTTVWKALDYLEKTKPTESKWERAEFLLKEAVADEVFGTLNANYRFGNAMARLGKELTVQGMSIEDTRLLELLKAGGFVEEREVEVDEEDTHGEHEDK